MNEHLPSPFVAINLKFESIFFLSFLNASPTTLYLYFLAICACKFFLNNFSFDKTNSYL